MIDETLGCDICPLNEIDITEEQLSQAQHLIDFEISEEQLIAAGKHNKFVDGVFFAPVEEGVEPLDSRQKVATYQCIKKKIGGTCLASEEESPS